MTRWQNPDDITDWLIGLAVGVAILAAFVAYAILPMFGVTVGG